MLEAQAATWVTLGVRVPQILAGTMTAAEASRMVSEKVAAAAESAQATSLAMTRLVLDPSRRRSPGALGASALACLAAAAKPYQARVKANAKRLRKSRGASR